MKSEQKYIKTRGQLTALAQNQLPNLGVLQLKSSHKKSTSSSNGRQEKNDINNNGTKSKGVNKTKQIKKTNIKGTKNNNTSKQSNPIVVKIQAKSNKQNKNIPPKINHIKSNSQQKIKLQSNHINPNNVVKQEVITSIKKNNQLQSSQSTVNQTNQSKIKIIIPNGIEKNSQQINKKLQPNRNKTKIEAKQENLQSGKIKIQNQSSLPKTITKNNKIKIPQKIIIEESQPQKSNKPPINIITQSSSSALFKKKGRPKKLFNEFINQQRPPEEQVKLEEFIQNAIKLRKLKSQKQFFQSFSRLVQYAQQSWQYGDLSRVLKWTPQRWEILKLGIPIVRGIRKQIQQQQLLNLVV